MLSWKLDADNYETDPELKKIREERGYTYMVCYNNVHLKLPYHLFCVPFRLIHHPSDYANYICRDKNCECMTMLSYDLHEAIIYWK